MIIPFNNNQQTITIKEEESEVIRFKIGEIYMMRSVCDHDCIWTYKVIARTAKTVTLIDRKKEVTKCRIRVWKDCEECKPLGTYSMCPVLCADKIF